MTTKYPHLFSPIKVNNLMLKNRIIAAPMGIIPSHKIISSTNYGNMSVFDKALGGTALVHIGGGIGDKENSIFAKYNRDVTREQISVAKQAGARCALELGLFSPLNNDGTVFGPIDGVRFDGWKMKKMNEADMNAIIEFCGIGACQARDFGFDLVTFHFAHDSLCSQFLSPYFNTRTDKYGGSLENRVRFPLEAIRRIREAVGPDYPIQMRVSRHLIVPESFESEDMLYFVQQAAPYVDMVNVSCGMDCYYEANPHSATSVFEPHLYNVEFASKIKESCDVLVSVVGAMMTPEEMEGAIASGKTDVVMVGRQLVADPFFPKKAQEGREEDIVPCLRCLYCYHIASEHANVVCSVNPRFRRENRVPLKLERAEKVKKVVVIGGGPGGMKAALTAAERGHQVILLERSERLGGQINCSDYDDYKQDLKRYRDYLLTQVKKSTVEVRLNTEATPEMVRKLEPDALIIAVGADVVTPAIPGVEHAKQAVEAYPHLNEMRGKIVVIGGGTIGSEIGLELAERGNTVHIVEITDTLNAQGNMLYRIAIRQHMEKCKTLHTMTETKCKEIKADGVVVEKDGEEWFLEADHILLATGLRSRRDMAHSFYGITPETAMIGDCDRVGKVLEATNDAYFIAANL
jgi:2,4-dienoyl-CoA reductase-like NADH-dependent reductase (Old Yellow Enzyme family)/thioredoxin reductase